MFRRIRLAEVLVASSVLIVALADRSRAQVPITSDLVPTQAVMLDGKPLTPLARVGLERNWFTVVPLVNQERLLLVSLAGDMVFAHTSESNLHAYDAESGKRLWTANIGSTTRETFPVAVNSNMVFVGGAHALFALDKTNGMPRWSIRLQSMPSSPTAVDEDFVTVGMGSGKLATYHLKNRYPAFFWQTNGPITSRPILAGPVIAFGSQDGRVYVAVNEPPKLVFRYLTGGPISADLGTYGTRTLLVPSADNNAYAVDLFTGDTRWTYSSGAPIDQQPLVAGREVYVLNTRGQLASIDAETGELHWTQQTGGGRLLAVGETRVYLESPFRDLYIVDRKSGAIVADARAVREGAGLDLRSFTITPTNSLTGRIYLAAPSGMIVCLREYGRVKPYLLRDPKQPPFGFVPRSGAAPATGEGAAPAETTTPPAPEEATTPPADAEKKAEDKKMDEKAEETTQEKPEGSDAPK